MYTEATAMTVSEIAEEVGVAKSAVYDCLRRRGIPLRDRRSEHKWDELDIEGIGLDYEEGKLMVREILVKYGIGLGRMYAILNMLQIPIKKVAQVKDTAIRTKYAVDMYKAGHPLTVIKAETGVSSNTLYNALAVEGIQPSRRDPGFDYDKACQMYADGKSMKEITIVTGIQPTPKLYRELSKRGIPLRYAPRIRQDEELLKMFKALDSDAQAVVKAAIELGTEPLLPDDIVELLPDSSQTSSEWKCLWGTNPTSFTTYLYILVCVSNYPHPPLDITQPDDSHSTRLRAQH